MTGQEQYHQSAKRPKRPTTTEVINTIDASLRKIVDIYDPRAQVLFQARNHIIFLEKEKLDLRDTLAAYKGERLAKGTPMV